MAANLAERRRYSSEALKSTKVVRMQHEEAANGVLNGSYCSVRIEDGDRGQDIASDCGTSHKEEIEKETSWKRILQRELGFGFSLQRLIFVFWKLRHRTRMMLTWEDAYYDGNQSEKKWFSAAAGSSTEGPYSHDLLGLAVSKMSYQVYSLGEGVVGKVAVSGKHLWIFSDELDSSSSSEYSDGWQAQFQAGIQTIVVVDVIPHGVVQLGTLHKISEDVKLVDHIRTVISGIQDSLPDCIPSSIKNNTENSCLSDTCTKIPDSTFHDSFSKTKGSFHEDDVNLWSQLLSPLGESVKIGDFSYKTLENNIQERAAGPSMPGNEISPFGFCAGYELYEALGPSFQRKSNDSIREAKKRGPDMAVDISEGKIGGSCSLLTGNSDGNLLEAVVARANSQKGYRTESERSCLESLVSFDRTPCNSLGTTISSCSLNSVKPNRKRARPGESTRPRPRDRQLIQDRIKELRELVPSGSKCSIDSLLERTIKHMMFLQSVTKHADKLNKCSVSKLLAKETGIRRFSCRDQGSSWAVELGNSQKVCPIIVENINMNGQMLVEMLSKESGQFLETAEALRSLGLNILKGVSEEAYGDQIWMCFVVEGENNRSMHRMDVLWSLMQLLQPKSAS
ncbi:basic helix-loop-helix (bHLH) DNA-bindingsuperfamily protein [Striga asiatica]|uniref:Basic helix-loop-helix (BHLH) DNA-bindingsuperfamily protein n=1 Tax=Striga asiatica TaxID=4170 RepID=A0A5A7NWN1_STRAF|nr:basic helix-loop-helix (bHLH) DNA-bindingsuperfamily protein [Striga asiatica]